MKTLYALDFDGTITNCDTLLAFIRYERGTWGLLSVMLRHLPQLILMKLHKYANERVKQQVFSHCFRGMSLSQFDTDCQQFASSHQHILRPAAIQTIQKAISEGHQVVIISASIDNWVRPFVPQAEVLGTQIEVKEGKLTGRFLTPNCYGAEKVRRLRTRFPDYQNAYLIAYGDSRGDYQLLASANESHYKPFR